MRILVLSAAIACVIVVPSVFARGNAADHGHAHAGARHSMHRHGRDNGPAERAVAAEQSSPTRSGRDAVRHPDEEELAVEEKTQKAN